MRNLYLLILAAALLAACQTELTAPTETPQPTETEAALIFTPLPTANPAASATPTLPPSATFTVTPTETATLTPSLTLSPTDTPTPTVTPTLERLDHYLFNRPIENGGGRVDWIDRTYPYGGTQFDQREVHLGVEFVNPRFTPILAAADGTVYFAGSDAETQIGPSRDYYGSVVILQHDEASAEGLPVYTLYGHMQRIEVQTGQRVQSGDKLGTIGDSGIAIGPHLHFEVRVGDPLDYRTTRNPELWLRPYREFGTLAGRVVDSAGSLLPGITLFVRAENFERETYTYGSSRVNSDLAWGENFTLGDLPEGRYDVIISNENGRIRFRQSISIESGRTTWIDIVLEDAGG